MKLLRKVSRLHPCHRDQAKITLLTKQITTLQIVVKMKFLSYAEENPFMKDHKL
jgi:hypothetical protein